MPNLFLEFKNVSIFLSGFVQSPLILITLFFLKTSRIFLSFNILSLLNWHVAHQSAVISRKTILFFSIKFSIEVLEKFFQSNSETKFFSCLNISKIGKLTKIMKVMEKIKDILLKFFKKYIVKDSKIKDVKIKYILK